MIQELQVTDACNPLCGGSLWQTVSVRVALVYADMSEDSMAGPAAPVASFSKDELLRIYYGRCQKWCQVELILLQHMAHVA